MTIIAYYRDKEGRWIILMELATGGLFLLSLIIQQEGGEVRYEGVGSLRGITGGHIGVAEPWTRSIQL